MSKIRVLLLTNRDSDNVGDQIIESTAISLIKGVMKNLDVPADGFVINSRAAGIISKRYMSTRDPALLEDARRTISNSDVIIFGGAPLFNYSYQNFYLRTILTLELAQEYGVPVLFSSIGVEPYDESNPKCRKLKAALTQSCVRQITTRDDIDSVRRYVEGTDIAVAHVSDPAVFADIVFRKAPPAKAAPASAAAPTPSFARRLVRKARRMARKARRALRATSAPEREAGTPKAPAAPAAAPRSTAEVAKSSGAAAEPRPKRIGLVVTRAGIFRDNQIEFTEEDQRDFWLDVIADLTQRGYDYRLFTTGHFSDEVFLDTFVKTQGIPASKAAFTVNSPEELTNELSACDGVIAYRLHASITCFAYRIPSIGLSWNFKVPYFYQSVDHGDRALAPDRWTAADVVPAMEKAMVEGVTADLSFLMSVYDTLFAGLKGIFAPDSDRTPFTYDELRTKLPRYGGTSQTQYRDKVRRKFRRTYENYQKYSAYYLQDQQAKKEGA
ncbi:polysaccharide pyruvyl transferase family protein [Microbacterium sp. 179-B 1A2 NHS]|uniref:polysaccharide pyruvyl transferase family protein n=1 Tax=Microbacterium sp. 179-B 1A2 NHS TaxID=3142383 RepID=UPI00399F6FA8